MEFDALEGLALGDREAWLAKLLPGSEDHDYYRALAAQHRGDFAEVDAILAAWPGRHGTTERYQRLTTRQRLYRVSEPGRAGEVAIEALRTQLGVRLDHEPEVAETDPSLPTRLPDAELAPRALLADAVERAADLSQVSDDGCRALLAHGAKLDAKRTRVLLARLGHSSHPALVAMIAADLEERGSGGFGSLAVHRQLTLAQLHALAERVQALRGDREWVLAVITRMRPPASIDLELDLAERDAYLRELDRFVRPLPSAMNSLKAHVLAHVIASQLRRGELVAADVVAYLQLPRQAAYARANALANVPQAAHVQLGADFAAATGLAKVAADGRGLSAAGTAAEGQRGVIDEELVRDALQRAPELAAVIAPHVERGWLEREVATATLLAGTGDGERATIALGPARAAELRDRVELAWCDDNPRLVGAHAALTLAANVKNVRELVVKIFRIDPIAYFHHHRRAVDTDLDLDGLAASHELAIASDTPPVVRVRRQIDLPMCARPGTYVIDLIGNGRASRALVHKGRLRYAMRIGAAGHAITVVDEIGARLPGARVWIGEREYVADERGAVVVPFSTSPGRVPMLLAHGDLTTVEEVELRAESYQLTMRIAIAREALATGGKPRAIVRLALTVGGAPATIALLQRATWSFQVTDRRGIAVASTQPLVATDDDACVLELPLGADPARLAVSVRGDVDSVSEQKPIELMASASAELATMYATTAIDALYLAPSERGFVLSVLGRSGEPRAHRAVMVGVRHGWVNTVRTIELATDDRGRIELGALAGVSELTATSGGHTLRWQLIAPPPVQVGLVHPEAHDFAIAIPADRDPAEVVAGASVVEQRGGAPRAHVDGALTALAGAIVVRGLPAGQYELTAPGMRAIAISIVAGEAIDTAVVARDVVRERTRAAPVIAELAAGDDAIRVVVRGATARTRVHVIATRFVTAAAGAAIGASFALGSVGARWPEVRHDRARGTHYVSGRELGDEIRYILERRAQARFPSLALDRPSLLLHPWSRRATSTSVQAARAGGEFAKAARAMPPPIPRAAAAPQAKRRGGGDADDVAYAGYDFIAAPPIAIANLALSPADGSLAIPRAQLADAAEVTIIVDDLAGSCERRLALRERPRAVRDLRLQLALAPDRHAIERKQIVPLAAGGSLAIADLATAKLHVLDTVAGAHAYLLALRPDPTLAEFDFVGRWHALTDADQRERYSKYACHELHLFLYEKAPAFFAEVVAPALAHKRRKTFVDHWLLGADLAAYLESSALARLNAVERALLAQRVAAGPQLARVLADEVALAQPDPDGDGRRIDALLGASALVDDSRLRAQADRPMHQQVASPSADLAGGAPGASSGGAYGAPLPPPAAMAMAPPALAAASGAAFAREEAPAIDMLDADRASRRAAPAPMFRGADRSQEWAETNWWQRTPREADGAMIAASPLWRDLARHGSDRGFLSPHLGLATTSFAEAMCALAMVDLPLVAGAHAIASDGAGLRITAATPALVAVSQIVDGELVGGSPVVVGTSFVRDDEPTAWVDGEQVDRYVTGPFAPGVVYRGTVALVNPASARERVSALVQIPRGSIAVGGARATETFEVALEPYSTHRHAYAFYFPSAGTWLQFPAHVSKAGVIVAAAVAARFEVATDAPAPDAGAWTHVARHGSTAAVVAAIATANLAAVPLDKLAWRLKSAPDFAAIISALEARHVYAPELWQYALRHRDVARIRAWLRASVAAGLAAGPVLDMPVIELDAEDLDAYEHLEISPLIHARAHRLGGAYTILNDGLAAQYRRFLDLVAHRRAPTREDLLAAAAYLLAQDRTADAIAMLARVDAGANAAGSGVLVERMQHAYLAAYAACLRGDVAAARALALPWQAVGVLRWRRRFAALLAMLAEVDTGTGIGAVGELEPPVGATPRAEQMSELAADQPSFELFVDAAGIRVRAHRIDALELRFFAMDVELSFSRQPFVGSDVSRFSFIEPGHREVVAAPAAEQVIAWPAQLRGKNVVVEAVAAGRRLAAVHYANDLATTLAQTYGQLRVQRAGDRAPLAATYVKAYARDRHGAVRFYKDGYTDLRGWFDYATLSTDDLDRVERFALLVVSDAHGAAILEAPPPQR